MIDLIIDLAEDAVLELGGLISTLGGLRLGVLAFLLLLIGFVIKVPVVPVHLAGTGRILPKADECVQSGGDLAGSGHALGEDFGDARLDVGEYLFAAFRGGEVAAQGLKVA